MNSAHVIVLVVCCLEQQVAFPPLHLHPQLTFVREVGTARLPHLHNTTPTVNIGSIIVAARKSFVWVAYVRYDRKSGVVTTDAEVETYTVPVKVRKWR
jgi:hypothetical protein